MGNENSTDDWGYGDAGRRHGDTVEAELAADDLLLLVTATNHNKSSQ